MTYHQNTWDEDVGTRCIKIKQVHGKLIQLARRTSVDHFPQVHGLWWAKDVW
jgi:hypothetical protein